MIPKISITVSDITVTYKNGHTALRNTNFSLPEGTIAALVGVNGSGKSTLLKAIMGFVHLASGSVSISGMSTRQALQRSLIAYVPQTEIIDWSFPVLVEDMVMMGRYGHMGVLRIPCKQDKLFVTKSLERVDMLMLRHRHIGELSAGQRKLLFLARAIAQQGKIILLDEPFTSVDVKTETKIINLLRELRSEGKTIFVATHNLGTVSTFCDHAVIVKNTVLASGPTETTLTLENLERAFGGMLRQLPLNTSGVKIITDGELPFVSHRQTGDN